MIYFENPKTLNINGVDYKIRTDYRDILTIIEAFEDKRLLRREKIEVMITILFEEEPPLIEETFEKSYMFLDVDIEGLCGYKRNKKSDANNNTETKLYSFVKDWQLIVAAMNKYFGTSIREIEYLHWFDFIAAFNNLGECSFNSVVDLRRRKKQGKLDKEEKQYFYKNREWLDLDYEEIDYKSLLNELNSKLPERG